MALTPEDVVNKRFQPTKFREGYDQDEVDDFLDEIVVEMRRLYQENDELRKKVAEMGGQSKSTGTQDATAATPVVTPAEPAADDKKQDEAKAEEKGDAAHSEPQAAAKEETGPAAAPATAAPAASAPAPTTSNLAAGTSSAESAAGVLAMAQQLHDQHVSEGAAQRDKIIAEAQIEASSLVNDAQEKSKKTLGALEEQRQVLERKVEQLRSFERDYRSRLKSYIEGQLRDLESRGSVAAPDTSN